MTSSRPYLIRAIRDWLVDNDLTPQIVVDATCDGVVVPAEHVHEGRIVLNISEQAVRGLVLGDEVVEADARFGGRPFHFTVPVRAVLAMVARENGAGMSFPPEPEPGPGGEPPGSPGSPEGGGGRRPSLRVVK